MHCARDLVRELNLPSSEYRRSLSMVVVTEAGYDVHKRAGKEVDEVREDRDAGGGS